MPSFKKFYKENRKKAIQSQKNSVKLLQLLMILCSYNFIKFSMCSYNFNVAVRISINLIQKLFAYLEGKTYLISLSIAICFLENCSIRGENEERATIVHIIRDNLTFGITAFIPRDNTDKQCKHVHVCDFGG